MEINEILLQAVILCFASFVQSAVGFAYSLFANSLLLLTGLSLPETVMITSLTSKLQSGLMLGSLWRHAAWRKTLPFSAVCLVILPAGIFLLRAWAALDLKLIKAGMGLLVLATLALQICWRVKPRPNLHWGWGALASASSGVLSGLANIGGPPLVLWVHAHDWPPERSRITVMAVTLPLAPFQLIMMFMVFGLEVMPSWVQLAVLSPAVILGVYLGLTAGKYLSRHRLRQIAYFLLAVIAVLAIAEPLLSR